MTGKMMVERQDEANKVEQNVALNKSGMYPLGTVISKQFDEVGFTGNIVVRIDRR
jgi:hypothetical protein